MQDNVETVSRGGALEKLLQKFRRTHRKSSGLEFLGNINTVTFTMKFTLNFYF